MRYREADITEWLHVTNRVKANETSGSTSGGPETAHAAWHDSGPTVRHRRP
ncbi:hypothetical protein [Streptomyces sp. NPDC056480]|uniref:hypothetical protein n=1 Tax=Streptomyces sp. NPDC056480 TaxID=3345833 RepID=UPI003685B14F